MCRAASFLTMKYILYIVCGTESRSIEWVHKGPQLPDE